jgi:hypothetical protein
MKLVYAVWGLALAVGACDGGERTATADTGTAEATVTTEASRDVVPDSQLQEQAQQAATAASAPVDGSGPVESTTAEPRQP